MWFTADTARNLAGVAGRLLLGCGLLSAAACGFRPLYGDSTAGNATTLATIAIGPIANRSGQQLRNLLLDRLSPKGPPAQPLYRLNVLLTESKQEFAIRKDETATRANLTVNATFNLVAIGYPRLGSLRGVARSTNSYNVLESDYATLSAENDARNRALASLAEEIRLRIAAGLNNPQLFQPPSAKLEKAK